MAPPCLNAVVRHRPRLWHPPARRTDASGGVLSHASDADNDPLTANLVGGSGPSHGTLTLNSDGSFTYTPTAGYTGSDRFQYTASDGSLTSSAATVTLTITNSGAPVANADSYSVERNNEFDADASTGVLANDTDSDGDTLTATLGTGPTHGTLTLNSDGSFSYIPTSGYTGSDSFTYTASDGVLTSSPATVTLTVSSSPPQANDDAYDMLQSTTLTVPSSTGVLANDYDPDNLPIAAVATSQPSYGSLTFNSDGSFTYTPISGYTGMDSFTYTASDGSLTSTQATVSIDVFASDSPPTTVSQQYTVAHNGDLTSSGAGVLTGASDPNGHPLAAVLDSDVQNGYLTLNPDGSFEYAPDVNFIGDDSFTYHATDGLANSAATTVTIHVTDQAPILTTPPPSFSVAENGSLAEDQPVLLSGAYDADGDEMMTGLVTGPTNGTLALQQDDTFTYEPNTAFIGTDSFTYEITDGLLNSDPITVTLQVQPGSPFQLDGRDAGSGSRWMDDTESESAGIFVSASDPTPAALLAHATGNPNYQRVITWDPSQLSITVSSGGSGGSSGSLTLAESAGDVQLTVVPVRAFAPGESANISMAVQDVQTQQQVAFLAVKAVQQKVQLTQLTFTSDQGAMHKGNLYTNGDALGGVYRPFARDGKFAENDPISQQADQPIAVTLTLSGLGVAAGTPYLLTGTSRTKGLTFSSPLGPVYAQLAAAGKDVTASASAPAFGSIGAIQGSITWTLILNPGTPQAQTIALGQTGVHRIYTTLGTPNQTASGVIVDGTVHDDPRKQPKRKTVINQTVQDVNPAAVTEARMKMTVQKVSQAIVALQKNGVKDPAPSQIVWQLMNGLGNFNLKASPNLKGVKAWGVGAKGATAQCFSMAEFVSLVAWMTGVPGTVTPKTYYALPQPLGNPDKALVGTLAKVPQANNILFPDPMLGNVLCRMALRDPGNGSNNFEAAVVYSYIDPKGKNKTVYFPGGTPPTPIWSNADDILTIFKSLVLEFGKKVEKTYRVYPAKPPNVPLP